MRCPYCEDVPGCSNSEPVGCEGTQYTLMAKEEGEEEYDYICDLTEYQCRDCGKSFFV